MGCCATGRERRLIAVPPTEEVISANEQKLEVAKMSASVCVQTIYKHCPDGKVSPNQLNTLGSELSINLEDVDAVDSKRFQLNKYFRIAKSCYDGYRIAVLSVLMGKGTIAEKADLLFEHCPWVEHSVLGEEGLRKLLGTMLDIAVDVLPRLAEVEGENPPVAGESLSHEELEAYLSQLREARQRVTDKVVTNLTLGGKGLSQLDFSSRLIRHKDEFSILSTSDLRLTLYTARSPASAPVSAEAKAS